MGAAQPDSRGGDGAEALLPSRVPDLQLHFLPIDLHGPNLEIYSNGGDVAACTYMHVSKAHRAHSRLCPKLQQSPRPLPTHSVPGTSNVPGTQP